MKIKNSVVLITGANPGIGSAFAHALIFNVAERRADLIAFGRSFIANPDWVARMRSGAAANDLDMSTFYTPGSKGYTDYPFAGD